VLLWAVAQETSVALPPRARAPVVQALLGGDDGDDADAAAARPMELLLGNAVRPLGKKSMGTVWMHHFGAEVAAVKWITLDDDPPHTAGYTAKQKESMMIREVEAMTVLRHPNIVALLGITSMDTPAGARPGGDAQRAPGEAERDAAAAGGSTRQRPPAATATVGIVLELCHFGTLQARVLPRLPACRGAAADRHF
jgi:hypothetical protein